MKSLLIAACSIVALSAFAADPQQRAEDLLKLVNAAYQALYKVESEAQWLASTDVKPEHDAAAEVAGKARAAFCGNPALIREAQELLKQKSKLKPITVRQLEQVLLNAAEGPMTNPKLVADRIAAETKQASTMNGFEFKLNGKPITVNELDKVLQNSTNLDERRQVWETSKQSGPALKPGLVALRDLRNGCAKELGHSDYFALQVAAYRMSSDEMLKLQDEFMRELRPLYLQLHTWVKYELAKKYGQPVPKLIPAHWINNRWSQEWDGVVEAANLDRYFTNRQPEWIVKTAEQFYTGLDFNNLPESFWANSDLYPVKP